MRGLLAVWILVHHVSPSLPGEAHGYLAVDIFFILSGFVLMQSHANDFSMPTWQAAADFWRRRVWRTIPLHLVCLLLAVAVGLVVRSALPGAVPFLQTALLLEGWAARGMDLNVPIWSLGTEWVGYLAFPLVALACVRVRTTRSLVVLIALVLSVELVGFALVPGAWPFSAPGLTLRLLRMAGGFVAGCLLWRLHRVTDVRPAQNDWLMVLAVVGAALTLWLSPFAGLVMPFLVLLVHAAAAPGRMTGFLLDRPIVAFLGRISFSLYLSHFLVLLLGLHYQGSDATVVWRIAMSTAIYVSALVTAFILCVTVEEPARRSAARRRQTSLRVARPDRGEPAVAR